MYSVGEGKGRDVEQVIKVGSILVVRSFVRTIVAAKDRLFLLIPLLLLAIVLDHAHSLVSQLQHRCLEIVRVAQLLKANQSIHCNTIRERDDTGQHLDLQLFDQEGRILHLDLDKLGLNVLLGQGLKRNEKKTQIRISIRLSLDSKKKRHLLVRHDVLAMGLPPDAYPRSYSV